MSIEKANIELACNTDKGCEAIDIIIKPREKDLGEFVVRRTANDGAQNGRPVDFL